MVTQVVRAEHTIIPKRAYTRARRSLGARGSGEETYARIAAAIEADVVIAATVAKTRRRAMLTIEVRDGVTGKVAESLRIAIPRSKLTRKVMKQTAEELGKVLAWL